MNFDTMIYVVILYMMQKSDKSLNINIVFDALYYIFSLQCNNNNDIGIHLFIYNNLCIYIYFKEM